VTEQERVLLTGYCQRRKHVMFRVLATSGGLIIDAELYCAGRESETWRRRRCAVGTGRHTSRYGCKCRRSALIGDDQIRDRIARGDTQWFVAAYNISRR
jgi:hypothetical protein